MSTSLSTAASVGAGAAAVKSSSSATASTSFNVLTDFPVLGSKSMKYAINQCTGNFDVIAKPNSVP